MPKTNVKIPPPKSKVHFEFSKDDLMFAPLGGSGEIGMNVNLYHFRDSWIMVDLAYLSQMKAPRCGYNFTDLKFIADRREKLAGLVLTHAMKIILELSCILGAKLAARFMALHSLLRCCGANSPSRVALDIPLHEIGMNAPQSGSFEIEMVALNHSIPDPAALAIALTLAQFFTLVIGSLTKPFWEGY